MPAGKLFWRAQLGHYLRRVGKLSDGYKEEVAYGPSRMKPRAERASEGRVNPKGIPCLYLSTTADAAMSEVRPWVGAAISLAQFKVLRPLTIVDCSVLEGQYFNLAFLNRTFDAFTSTTSTTPSPDEFEKIVWAAIDTAFSAPVTESDDVANTRRRRPWPSFSEARDTMESRTRAPSVRKGIASLYSTSTTRDQLMERSTKLRVSSSNSVKIPWTSTSLTTTGTPLGP